MKARKKCYQSYKFWITTLLALSATSIFASLVLTSCTVNVTKNEDITSDVVISKEPDKNQEVSTDNENGLTLSIDAKSTQGKDLKYQWYVDKTQLDNWNAISGATSSSYQIPSSELKSVTSESTWRYKAEIQYNDGSNDKLTSSVYTIKITPPTSTTPPENPSPEPTPPIVPEEPKPDTPTNPNPIPPNPENPITPPTPNPSPQPPTKPEEKPEPKPPITKPEEPKPEEKPTEIVNPRNPTFSGLTKVEREQEKWIGDNSISMCFYSSPDMEYLKTYVSSYLATNTNDKNSSDSDKRIAYELLDVLNTRLNNSDNGASSGYRISSNVSAGTGWLLDYSINKETSDLVNYYLATNMHVLDLTYSISYSASIKDSSGQQVTASTTLDIPVSKESVKSLDVYLTQPQYSENGPEYNTKVPFGQKKWLSSSWFKTSITKDDFNSCFVPLGSYTSTGNNSLSKPYKAKIKASLNNSYLPKTYYYHENGISTSTTLETSNSKTNDFSLLKLSENKSTIDRLGSGVQTIYSPGFKKIKTIFDTNTNNNTTTKNSSYISKLNALLSLTNSQEEYTKNKIKIDELFMFADSQLNLNNSTTLSIAGFPAISSGDKSYINFNSNSISYSLHQKPNSDDFASRKEIEYNYQGNLYYSKYKWDDNMLLRGIDLLSGSSGSMAITQDYKIAGIYWGVTAYYDENQKPVYEGLVTKLYSESDPNSILKTYLEYIKKVDPNSKLSQLFTNLNKYK